MLKSTCTFVVRADSTISIRSLEAVVTLAGEDVVVVVTGGDRPHVGSVVLAQSCGEERRPSCSLLTIPPHKEEAIARPIAERVCRSTQTPALVSAGVHEDGIDQDGIAEYLELADQLALSIVTEIRNRRGHRSGEPDRT